MNRCFPRVFVILAASCLAGTAQEPGGQEEIVFEDVPPTGETGGPLAATSLFLSGEGVTDYVYRGRDFSDGAGIGRVDLTVPLAERTALGLGGKYVWSDLYEEGQGFLSIEQGFGAFRAALGYRYYGLDAGDRSEAGLLIGTVLGGFNLRAAYYYDFELEGHYFEAYGEREWRILDPLALRATATLAGSSGYWYGDSGFNHAEFRLDFPVYLRDWMTLTPWVAASLPMEAVDDFEDDTVFGGLTLQVAF